MNWIYQNKEINVAPEGQVGFVYLIVNNLTGQKYIGKKFLYSRNRIKISGRKNRRIVIKESNWCQYFGSSDILLEDIEKYGKENFTREILNFYPTKKEVSYAEIEQQFLRDVLHSKLPNGFPAYYNKSILGKFFGNSPMFGKEHSEETKKKMSKSAIDKFTPEYRKQVAEKQKGKHPSEETLEKLRRAKSGKNSPMFGVHRMGKDAPHYGMKHSIETLDKISKSNKGKIPWNKGRHTNPTNIKCWLVTFPDSHQEEIKNLKEFCINNNILQYSNFIKYGKSKGFLCKRLLTTDL